MTYHVVGVADIYSRSPARSPLGHQCGSPLKLDDCVPYLRKYFMGSTEGDSNPVQSNNDGQSSSNVAQALSRLESIIEQRIDTLKRDLISEHEDSISRLSKRLKVDKQHTFKHDGNREQYEHQIQVKDALESAFNALVNSKIDNAQSALQEGMLLIDKRLKYIVLADKYG